MLRYTDNPLRDFALWSDDQEEWLNNRPECSECGQHIQDDYLYRIDGNIYCQNCIDQSIEYID